MIAPLECPGCGASIYPYHWWSAAAMDRSGRMVRMVFSFALCPFDGLCYYDGAWYSSRAAQIEGLPPLIKAERQRYEI